MNPDRPGDAILVWWLTVCVLTGFALGVTAVVQELSR